MHFMSALRILDHVEWPVCCDILPYLYYPLLLTTCSQFAAPCSHYNHSATNFEGKCRASRSKMKMCDAAVMFCEPTVMNP